MRSRILAVPFAFLILLAAAPCSSHAQHVPAGANAAIHEVPLATNSSQPLGLTTDSQGNVWFAESGKDSIAEYVPSNQTLRQFRIPTERHTAFIWFLVFDRRGSLWFADSTESLLWEFTPSSGRFENFSLAGSKPFGLVYDAASDRLWFSSTYTDQLGLIQLGKGANIVRVVSLPSFGYTGVGPAGMALDGAGHLYVAETFAGKIVEYDENSLELLSSWYLGNTSRPVGIAVSGGRVWFTNHATSLFGYLSLATGSIVEISTPLTTSGGSPIISLPYWIAVSKDGSVWFDEHFGNSIARFNPGSMQLTDFELGRDSWPLRLAVDDSHNRVWFTEFGAGRIGWISENSSAVGQLAPPGPIVFVNGGSVVLHLARLPGYGGPSVTGSLTAIGVIDSNFSVSVNPAPEYYSITMTPVQVRPGNYTVTLCISNYPVVQCAVKELSASNTPVPFYSPELLLVAGIALAGILVAYLLTLRARLPFPR